MSWLQYKRAISKHTIKRNRMSWKSSKNCCSPHINRISFRSKRFLHNDNTLSLYRKYKNQPSATDSSNDVFSLRRYESCRRRRIRKLSVQSGATIGQPSVQTREWRLRASLNFSKELGATIRKDLYIQTTKLIETPLRANFCSSYSASVFRVSEGKLFFKFVSQFSPLKHSNNYVVHMFSNNYGYYTLLVHVVKLVFHARFLQTTSEQ